jgi:hypothetical protein
VTVPAGNSAAHDVIDAFCTAVTFGSRQVIELQLSPLRVVVTIVLLLAIARFLLHPTSWAPCDPVPSSGGVAPVHLQ